MFLPSQVAIFLCIIFYDLTLAGSLYSRSNQFATDCGNRPQRRDTKFHNRLRYNAERTPKIIAGTATKDGQFPWQVSLELLHPSMGFLGHWCGGVLIHKNWILSAAHCVHNDLFNLPIPPLWTVVLGEHDRLIETGYEQRIPVEKIVMHHRYENFLHDLVLMKLSKSADLHTNSNIRKICLPFTLNNYPPTTESSAMDELQWGLSEVPEKVDNFLRSAQNFRRRSNITMPSMQELMSTKILSQLRRAQTRVPRSQRNTRRRNDKLMKVHLDDDDDLFALSKKADTYKDLPFTDCIATGWGKANLTGDLTNLLLKTKVPLHTNKRCREAYGSFVRIHQGHLCAGKLNGKGGTCVGDSGGPLQCRVTRDGPWILAGITSFGSGCAIEGYPDVYARTSFYMKWIQDTIAYE